MKQTNVEFKASECWRNHKLHGILVDPFKTEVSLVVLDRGPDELNLWHKILDCHYVECVRLSHDRLTGKTIDLWCDEEFLLKDVAAPAFQITNERGKATVIHGYSLIFGGENYSGETICLPLPEDGSFEEALIFLISQCFKLKFELISASRFKGEEFIPQRMRGPIEGMKILHTLTPVFS